MIQCLIKCVLQNERIIFVVKEKTMIYFPELRLQKKKINKKNKVYVIKSGRSPSILLNQQLKFFLLSQDIPNQHIPQSTGTNLKLNHSNFI